MSRKSVAAQIEKRRSVVSANLLAGNTYRQIAAGLGVSIGTVSNDVKMLLRQWKRENIQTINDWKILAIERINRLIMAIWLDADKGDEGAIATFIKLEKRLSEISGYDAPLVPDDAEIKVPAVLPTLPADVLSPAFLDVYRDIRDRIGIRRVDHSAHARRDDTERREARRQREYRGGHYREICRTAARWDGSTDHRQARIARILNRAFSPFYMRDT